MKKIPKKNLAELSKTMSVISDFEKDQYWGMYSKQTNPKLSLEQSVLRDGLFHGGAGLCLLYYHTEQRLKQAQLKEKAETSYQTMLANLKNCPVVDFENGLAGIGWVMEYLRQNNFVDVNIDEILEFADNAVFNKLVNEEPIQSLDLANGLTGYLLYCISRLESPVDTNSTTYNINKELLIFIINRIDEVAIRQFALYNKDMNFDLLWSFPVMLYGLTLAHELNIYNYKIEYMITQWLDNLEVLFPSLHINRVYMAMVLTLVSRCVKNPRIERQSRFLLSTTDFATLRREIDPCVANIRYGWYGIIWVLKRATRILSQEHPNYENLKMCYDELNDLYKPELEKSAQKFVDYVKQSQEKNETPTLYIKDIGLSEGWAGISLMELINPAMSYK